MNGTSQIFGILLFNTILLSHLNTKTFMCLIKLKRVNSHHVESLQTLIMLWFFIRLLWLRRFYFFLFLCRTFASEKLIHDELPKHTITTIGHYNSKNKFRKSKASPSIHFFFFQCNNKQNDERYTVVNSEAIAFARTHCRFWLVTEGYGFVSLTAP